ncbi:MAG TPA: signal peptidase II [Longimicrobiaceae bacterium]|nr:signal peptidase II [Longimicrobiaceae bacterium]
MNRLTALFRRLQGERRARRTGGRRRSDFEPNRGWRVVLALALGVALLDWTTKAAVAASVPLEGFVEVWRGRVALWHVRNDAMMLGLWDGFPIAVRQGIALVAGAVAFLVVFQVVGRMHRLRPGEREWAWAFAGLAYGGMLGNLGERALHWGVTDYLSFAWGDLWLPPGNVADVALFAAIPLAVPVILFELRGRARRAPRQTVPSPGARPLARA